MCTPITLVTTRWVYSKNELVSDPIITAVVTKLHQLLIAELVDSMYRDDPNIQNG